MGFVSGTRNVRGAAARWLVALCALAVALAVAAACWGHRLLSLRRSAVAPAQEPTSAAEEGPIDFSALPNFHKVSDDLYRGSQPGYKGYGQLKRMGIKTVVNLRTTATSRRSVESIGLVYEHVPIYDVHAYVGHALTVLRIVADKKRCPVFVYCLDGADRTGFICAAYRIAFCGWSKEDAIREMLDSRFGTGIEFGKLPARLREMDVEAFRKDLGLIP